MYQISDLKWAIEDGERIAFVRDGGGVLHVEAGDECEPAPLISENGIDLVVIEVIREP